MSQRPKLEIPVGSEAKVSLLFDNPKTGLSASGEWRLYGVNHNGVEKSFFASDKAHEIMQHYNKGDSVLIEHKKIQDGKTVYLILNPLCVPSRMNLGQLYEAMLGWAGKELNKRYKLRTINSKTGLES